MHCLHSLMQDVALRIPLSLPLLDDGMQTSANKWKQSQKAQNHSLFTALVDWASTLTHSLTLSLLPHSLSLSLSLSASHSVALTLLLLRLSRISRHRAWHRVATAVGQNCGSLQTPARTCKSHSTIAALRSAAPFKRWQRKRSRAPAAPAAVHSSPGMVAQAPCPSGHLTARCKESRLRAARCLPRRRLHCGPERPCSENIRTSWVVVESFRCWKSRGRAARTVAGGASEARACARCASMP